MSAANIRRQLDIERALFGIRYGNTAAQAEAIANALAERLAGAGVEDVRELRYYRGTDSTRVWRCHTFQCGDADCTGCDWEPVTFPVAWFYNQRTNARVSLLNTAAEFTAYCTGVVMQGDQEVAVPCPGLPPVGSALQLTSIKLPDRYWATVYVMFQGGETAPKALPVFVVQLLRDDTNWSKFGQAVAFWLAAVSFVVPGINAVIGSAVFGAELAAAYPTLVSLATNTALNTALNGGDIAAAVTKAVAGLVGAQVGSFAGETVDSRLVGRLTGAATTAAINGGDVLQAVALSGLQFTADTFAPRSTPVTAAPSSPVVQPAPVVAPTSMEAPMGEDDYGFELPTDALGQDYVFGGQIIDMGAGFDAQSLDVGGDSGEVFTFDVPGTYDGGMPSDDTRFVDTSTDGGFVGPPDLPANQPPMSPSDSSNGWDWGDALGNITQAAMAALKVYTVYRAAGSPGVRAPGPAQVVNRNGTVTTRSPTGVVSTGRPVAGQPVAAPDGTILLNNGNDTYTVISPDGTQHTYPYPAAGTGVVPGFFGGAGTDNTKLLLYGGLAFGGLYLLSQRRR